MYVYIVGTTVTLEDCLNLLVCVMLVGIVPVLLNLLSRQLEVQEDRVTLGTTVPRVLLPCTIVRLVVTVTLQN